MDMPFFQIPMVRWLTIGIDVLFVYLLIYWVLLWLKNTYAYHLIKGLFGIFIIVILSYFTGLTTLNWLLGKLSTVLALLIIIIFQPELRRFLERIGTGRLFSPLLLQGQGQNTKAIRQVIRACELLAKERIGAIIAIEVSTNLTEFCETGIEVTAELTSELLANLFWPGSPTHDGAAIVRQNKIVASGCLLPLTETVLSDRRLGTRHRAALGLSQLSDAIVIVISEETGVISIAENGNLNRFLNKEALETRLFSLYKEDRQNTIFPSIKRFFFKKKGEVPNE